MKGLEFESPLHFQTAGIGVESAGDAAISRSLRSRHEAKNVRREVPQWRTDG